MNNEIRMNNEIIMSLEEMFPDTNREIIESIFLFYKKDTIDTIDALVTINTTDYHSIQEIEDDLLIPRETIVEIPTKPISTKFSINNRPKKPSLGKIRGFFKNLFKKNEYNLIPSYDDTFEL